MITSLERAVFSSRVVTIRGLARMTQEEVIRTNGVPDRVVRDPNDSGRGILYWGLIVPDRAGKQHLCWVFATLAGGRVVDSDIFSNSHPSLCWVDGPAGPMLGV